MINEIITGISRTIDSVFNNESDIYAIYDEKVEQGLQEPCFLIQIVNAMNEPLLYLRSKRTYDFDVIYISKNKSSNELLDIGEKLISALNWITLLNGNKLMAFEKHYEIVDDVLHFFVTYPAVMRENEEKIPMDNYSLDNEIFK